MHKLWALEYWFMCAWLPVTFSEGQVSLFDLFSTDQIDFAMKKLTRVKFPPGVPSTFKFRWSTWWSWTFKQTRVLHKYFLCQDGVTPADSNTILSTAPPLWYKEVQCCDRLSDVARSSQLATYSTLPVGINQKINSISLWVRWTFVTHCIQSV